MALAGFTSLIVFPIAGVLAILAIREGPRRWLGILGLVVAVAGLACLALDFPTPQCSLDAHQGPLK